MDTVEDLHDARDLLCDAIERNRIIFKGFWEDLVEFEVIFLFGHDGEFIIEHGIFFLGLGV